MRTGRISLKHSATGELRISIVDDAPPMVRSGDAKRAPLSIATNPQCAVRDSPKVDGVAGFGGMPRHTSFTKLAQRRVREVAAAIELELGKENCRFLTGTLPGSTNESLEYIARYSGWLVKNIEQWVRDKVPSAHFVIVWEFQKRGALHCHCLLGADDPRGLYQVARGWKRKWVGLLKSISRRAGVDMFARRSGGSWAKKTRWVRADVQRVKKSVGRYLGKYLSKSASKLTMDAAFCPSRWWGCFGRSRDLSASLSTVARSARLSLSDCLRWWQVLQNELSCVAGAVFSFQNPWLPWCHTAIAYMPYQSGKTWMEDLLGRSWESLDSNKNESVVPFRTDASQSSPPPPPCLVGGAVCYCQY